MPQCEKTEKCPFFNDRMANMPSIAESLKQKFCRADKESCARYQVGKAGIQVPDVLFPSDTARAGSIISQAKK